MKIIEVKKLERRSQEGMDFHDLLRDGRAFEFDIIFVSILIKKIVDTINELIREVELLKQGGIPANSKDSFVTKKELEQVIKLFGKKKKKRG